MKEAQILANRITSLLRFISRIAERARPIMNPLKKTKNFIWDEDCEEAFWKLKVTLVTPPILLKPDTTKMLIVYHSISIKAITMILVQEEKSE